MKLRFIVADRANADLSEIWFYIARKNESAADRVIDQMYDKFDLLCSVPGAGRVRDDLALDIRTLPVGRYVIFYFLTAEFVEISRILHGARDTAGLFQQLSPHLPARYSGYHLEPGK